MKSDITVRSEVQNSQVYILKAGFSYFYFVSILYLPSRTFFTQSAFYTQSANSVCVLHSVCILHPVCSLRFTPTVYKITLEKLNSPYTSQKIHRTQISMRQTIPITQMQKQQYHLTSLHQAIPIPACFLSPTKDTSRRKARETFIILPNLASSPVNFLASGAARSD